MLSFLGGTNLPLISFDPCRVCQATWYRAALGTTVCTRSVASPGDKLLMSVTAFADEPERDRARQRTYDALERKARARHVTGGRVYGYDNVEVQGPDGRRQHVIR